jgi:hypothetical protein
MKTLNTQWDFLCDIKIPNYTLRLIKHPHQERYGWLLPLNLIKHCHSQTRSNRYFTNYVDAQMNLLCHLKKEGIDISDIKILPPSPRKIIKGKSKLPANRSTQITLTGAERHSISPYRKKEIIIRRALSAATR